MFLYDCTSAKQLNASQIGFSKPRVVSGLGFLSAGMFIRTHGSEIKGLTAASGKHTAITAFFSFFANLAG
jgi:hypothetical protein